MAKHIVKCAVCKKSFDTNVIQAVRHGVNRYAHATCEPDNTNFIPLGPEADPELVQLKDYIKNLFGDKTNWAMVTKQIKDYHENQGFSYNSILKSLVYFYEHEHGDKEKANGAIGIVPFVYNAAKNYYLALFMAQHANEDKTLVTNVKEYTIPVPKMRGTKHRTLDWSIEDEE